MDLNIPVIGILRGIGANFFGPLMEAAFEAGLQAIEVTMNTDGAETMIAAQRPKVPDGNLLGMGTVRNVNEARLAMDAGAMFLVTPNTDAAVIELAAARGIPVVAGAFTPTEVYHAWSSGADMVKVFPCTHLGPRYIRDLKGPFDQIPMVAVGGVSAANASDFLSSGAQAVGVGTSLFGRQALKDKDPLQITANVRHFIRNLKPAHV